MSKLFSLFFLVIISASSIQAQSVQEIQDKINECYSSRDYKCAEKEQKKLIKKSKKSPNLARYYSDLGTIQRRLGKNKDALKSYDKAIKLENDRVVFYTNRATLHMQLENYEKGNSDFESAIELDPNNWEIASDYATFKKRQGLLKEALEDFNMLIQKYPEELIFYNNRADTFLRMGDHDAAFKDINFVLEKDPEYQVAIITKGEIYLDLEQTEEACSYFKQAVDKGFDANRISYLLKECK